MIKKTLITLTIVATFLVTVGVAQAQTNGFGNGMDARPVSAHNERPSGPGSRFHSERSHRYERPEHTRWHGRSGHDDGHHGFRPMIRFPHPHR
ncbi:MAG: hypothetical protein HQK55_18000 [Deltaproteobacteria bacterium]|nr:hypothetical protein [Deltaproteobacteria bacterium]